MVNLNKITIGFTWSNIPVNIEIIQIKQNVQRIISGMSAEVFSD